MELFKNMLVQEHVKAANKEIDYCVTIINKIYNEWKKRKRRINAVDVVTTSVNKIANINPVMVDYIHKAARAKLVIIIMRCLDTPVWKPLETKEKIYIKLYPLIKRLQNDVVNTGTNGRLRDVIMTRLSAAISHQTTQCEVFVAYESRLPTNYIRFLFGSTPPMKTYRMQSLLLPADFDTLVDTLKINQEKAIKKYGN